MERHLADRRKFHVSIAHRWAEELGGVRLRMISDRECSAQPETSRRGRRRTPLKVTAQLRQRHNRCSQSLRHPALSVAWRWKDRRRSQWLSVSALSASKIDQYHNRGRELWDGNTLPERVSARPTRFQTSPLTAHAPQDSWKKYRPRCRRSSRVQSFSHISLDRASRSGEAQVAASVLYNRSPPLLK